MLNSRTSCTAKVTDAVPHSSRAFCTPWVLAVPASWMPSTFRTQRLAIRNRALLVPVEPDGASRSYKYNPCASTRVSSSRSIYRSAPLLSEPQPIMLTLPLRVQILPVQLSAQQEIRVE